MLISRDTVTVQTIKVIWNSPFTNYVPSHHVFNIFSDIFVRLPNLHVQNLSILLFSELYHAYVSHNLLLQQSIPLYKELVNSLLFVLILTLLHVWLYPPPKKRNPATLIPHSLLKRDIKKTRHKSIKQCLSTPS